VPGPDRWKTNAPNSASRVLSAELVCLQPAGMKPRTRMATCCSSCSHRHDRPTAHRRPRCRIVKRTGDGPPGGYFASSVEALRLLLRHPVPHCPTATATLDTSHRIRIGITWADVITKAKTLRRRFTLPRASSALPILAESSCRAPVADSVRDKLGRAGGSGREAVEEHRPPRSGLPHRPFARRRTCLAADVPDQPSISFLPIPPT